MAYLAVDKNGEEWIYEKKPYRLPQTQTWNDSTVFGKNCINLPNGTIEKIIGRKLTWNDDAVKLE